MEKTRINLLPDFIALGCVAVLFLLLILSSNGNTKIVKPEADTASAAQVVWFLAAADSLEETRLSTVVSALESAGEQLGDASVTITVGSLEKLAYQVASRDIPEIVTAPYRNPQIQYYLRPRRSKALDVLYEHQPDQNPIDRHMLDWYGNSDGHLYGLVDFPAVEPPGFYPGVLMLARQDILNTLGLTPDIFQTKEGTLSALKALRKRREGIIPAYFDLESFQQMFGLRIESPEGEYQDPFFHPATLEAVKFLNTLYIEKLIPQDVFLLSKSQKHQKMRQGKIFAVTGTDWDSSMKDLAQRSPASYFVCAGPVKGDSENPPLFESLDNQGKWVTFLMEKESAQCPDNLLLRLIQTAGKALEKPEPVKADNQLDRSLLEARQIYQQYTFNAIPYRAQMVYPIGCLLETLGQQIEAVRQSACQQMIFSPTGDEIEELYQSACATIETLKETIIPLWETTCFQHSKELAGRETYYPAIPKQDAG